MRMQSTDFHRWCNILLDEFPKVMDTRKAVQQLSSGKAPGAGAIPAEVHTHGKETDRVVSLYMEVGSVVRLWNFHNRSSKIMRQTFPINYRL